jgi:ferric enterobactin receptor
MRYILLCLFLIASQTLIAQKQYSFDFTNKNLLEVVEELSSKHKFKFSFNPTALATHTINKKIKANSDAELISKIFDGLPFSLQLSDGVYLVIPKKIEPKPRSLTGQIYDSKSGEPLAFAHVSSDKKGTVSNQSGRFSLPPRTDTLTLKISYIGYKELEMKVAPTDQNISLRLEQNPMMLQEVILSTSEADDLTTHPSFFSMNPAQFSALPTLGETDVFKSIQLLPGIQATDETSSGLSVRGNIPSQNLVLMDGFTLYNLDHFFGIFSTLNPNVINNVSIYKGGFGSEYGGRVSSIIDVTGKTGSSDLFSGSAGLNLLSANAFIEAPLGKKTTVLFGIRKSFSDIVNSSLYKDFLASNRKGFLNVINSEFGSLELSPSIEFHDLNAKIQHRFNPTSTLGINLFLSEDFYNGDFEEGNDDYSFTINDAANWSNAGISVDWNKQFRPNWFGDVIISASEFSEKETLDVSQTFFKGIEFDGDSVEANSTVEFFDYKVGSSIGDFTIKSNHKFNLDERNKIKTGIELNTISTFYNSDQLFFENFSSDTTYRDTLNLEAGIMNLYGSYQFRTNDFSTNVGFRTSYYEPTAKWYFEPRFDLNFHIDDHFTIKGATSFHHQFATQTSLSIFQNADRSYWVLADDDVIPIQKATHFIIGGNYSKNNWAIDLEYYQKHTTGIIDNYLSLPPEIIAALGFEDLNLSGENNSEGIDLFVKYRNNKFNSWLSYSLSSSENQFWYRNNNRAYPSDQDQRHEINISNMLKLGKWELSSIILYGSGRPYTPSHSDSINTSNQDIFDQLYDLSKINSKRYAPYKRLDLSAKYSFTLGKMKCEAGITLFNVFNHSNIKSRKYFKQYAFDENTSDPDAEDEIKIIALDTYLLGFTPNFFIQINF